MTDREKMIELMNKVQDYGTKSTYEEHSITVESKNNESIADHLLANGVTVPVRCKDCKHRYFNDCFESFCCAKRANGFEDIVEENEFCSRGERKDNGKE